LCPQSVQHGFKGLPELGKVINDQDVGFG